MSAPQHDPTHATDQVAGRTRSARRAVLVGIGCAALTVLLLFVGNLLESKLIEGTAYTDLPGQDTLALVLTLEPYGIAVIVLAAGRLCGIMSTSFRWLAVLISVVPLLALTAVSPRGFWYWFILAPVLGNVAAYLPSWSARRRTYNSPGGREVDASRRTSGCS